MRAFFSNRRSLLTVFFVLSFLGFCSLGWWGLKNAKHSRTLTFMAASAPFSDSYPKAQRIIKELSQLRQQNHISPLNENLIHNSVKIAAEPLEIPPALLWCLLFQESRLNHLSGIEERSLATGLGQFSFSAFFEINHQLSRYLPSAKSKVTAILGQDVRPISADFNDPTGVHSYYHIPTAVTASALFLHNRWIQLYRVAHQRDLSFSPELLWAWAALSYNKGGRTVLSLWNGIEQKYGTEALTEALHSPKAFSQHLNNSPLVHSAISYIWTDGRSKAYSEELITHSKNLGDCSFRNGSEGGDR